MVCPSALTDTVVQSCTPAAVALVQVSEATSYFQRFPPLSAAQPVAPLAATAVDTQSPGLGGSPA